MTFRPPCARRCWRRRAQLGYQPNATRPDDQPLAVVALFMPNIGNPIYPFVLQTFSHRLRSHGRQILLLPLVENANEGAGVRAAVPDRRPRLITAASPLALSEGDRAKYLAAGIPVVLFNRYFLPISRSRR
ncbi:MAG: hypothetical protein IPO58_12555 [Betaproteobacteria bacterium]|nr:hypothetical protein [Betaproteobacteria bacterium]